jgi:hypothetical protein
MESQSLRHCHGGHVEYDGHHWSLTSEYGREREKEEGVIGSIKMMGKTKETRESVEM